MIDKAIELNHEIVAITDHETISASIRAQKYYKKIKKDNPNFKLILGNEIYLCRNGLNKDNFNREYDRYYHFILLAKDSIGHQQIREISTRAWDHSYHSRGMIRVPTYYQDIWDIIKPNPGHVIASTACLGGLIPVQLLKYRENKNPAFYEKILNWCQSMVDVFGDGNFYLEMQPSKNEDQIYVNNELIKISNKLNIPFIITTDSHYLSKEDRKVHRAFLKSQNGDRETDSFYATTYMMDTNEIYQYMEEYIGEENLQKSFQNILKIKDMCEDYDLTKPLKIPRLFWKTPKRYISTEEKDYWFNKIPELLTFYSSNYEEDKRLSELIIDRVRDDISFQNQETYNEINECLKGTWQSSEVNGARWSAYFLNLQNIVDSCWEAGSLVGAGRGSGVGFILLYILGITQINPLREKTRVFRWRFLNPARVSVLDVDVDIEGSRREDVLKHFRDLYGKDRVANVLTLKTEKSKSAILTAARGLGIDVDIAQYLSSMIVADRGILRTLSQTFYGDEKNGILPNKQFRYEMENNYPELWEVASKIEGLVNGCNVHAGGVIFVDESFTNSTALMRAPSGEIITQYDLHSAESVGLIKYDILSIEALDKIHNCLDLLVEYNYIQSEKTLKETYEKVVGIYNLERDNKEMWKLLWNHKVMSLFQMEKQSGIQGISLMKPTSVDDLAILNSAIRLMAQEKGAELPIHKLARFKANPNEWDKELKQWGLGEKEKKILEPIVGISYGLCIAQEQFMQLVQLPELGGFDLTFADRLRKSIAKKNPKEYDAVMDEFFRVTKEKGCNDKLCKYAAYIIGMSKGYGFNQSHTLAYSLVGLQELNLAYFYPIVFWNCACLISDSGGGEREENNNIEDEDFLEDETTYTCFLDDFAEKDEDEDDEEEDEEEKQEKGKKKTKTTEFGKIATAIGKIKAEGIDVYPPDINESHYTFTPDVEKNIIRYGLSGISRIGEDLIKEIIANRPYTSIEDVFNKVKLNKPQAVNLIKSGALDSFGNRQSIMKSYIGSITDKKKLLNLRNMKMLMNYKLIPDDYRFERSVYNFNKYLKKNKSGLYYILDEIAFNFYERYFDMDLLSLNSNGQYQIVQKNWDKIYNKKMDTLRAFIKNNQEELLYQLNNALENELWNKYAYGNMSKWEMDSVSFYYHDHELKKVTGYSNFYDLESEPVLDRVIVIKGKEVPLFKINRIIGTVLDKDKNKRTVTLLTTAGVVTVKIFGDAFTNYDKQISEKQADGKKKVIEKSWFSRGNKIIVTGIRREDMFIAKKYKDTPYHLVELVVDIDENGNILTQEERTELK